MPSLTPRVSLLEAACNTSPRASRRTTPPRCAVTATAWIASGRASEVRTASRAALASDAHTVAVSSSA
jgi:hypothetical protein